MILFLGFLFMLFFFTFIGTLSRSFMMLMDLPSALLIFVSLLFFLLVSRSGKIIGKYISVSFKKNYTYTKAELEKLSSAIRNTIKFILAVGGFCFMASAVISLGHIGAPERLGPNLAMSLITLTYSIAIGFFVFFPTLAWAENKINTIKDDVLR